MLKILQWVRDNWLECLLGGLLGEGLALIHIYLF